MTCLGDVVHDIVVFVRVFSTYVLYGWRIMNMLEAFGLNGVFPQELFTLHELQVYDHVDLA